MSRWSRLSNICQIMFELKSILLLTIQIMISNKLIFISLDVQIGIGKKIGDFGEFRFLSLLHPSALQLSFLFSLFFYIYLYRIDKSCPGFPSDDPASLLHICQISIKYLSNICQILFEIKSILLLTIQINPLLGSTEH